MTMLMFTAEPVGNIISFAGKVQYSVMNLLLKLLQVEIRPLICRKCHITPCTSGEDI